METSIGNWQIQNWPKFKFKIWSVSKWVNYFLRGHHQISVVILSELEQINLLLFPLKSPEKHRFSRDLRGNRS